MGLQLKYTGVTLPDGVGETFYPNDGVLADGSMMLFDWSNPACMAQDTSDIRTASNLAAQTLDDLYSGAEMATATAYDATATPLSSGRGLYKAAGNTGASGRTSLNPNTAVKDYIYAGGVQEDQPDILSVFWVRFDPNVNDDTRFFSWGTSSRSPAMARLEISTSSVQLHGDAFSTSSLTSGNSNLNQIAMSRSEIFLNGEKLRDFSQSGIDNYDDFVNTVLPAASDQMWITYSSTLTADSGNLYRMYMENFAASQRSALEAVKADYEYVMNNASFVDTV